jgi:hypothetical protein
MQSKFPTARRPAASGRAARTITDQPVHDRISTSGLSHAASALAGSGAADAPPESFCPRFYGHASSSRETGRHPALRPPSTVSRPESSPAGRADDFECEL